MASSRIGRLLPFSSHNVSPSIYETIRQHDEDSDASDVEERAAMAIDEENLRHNFNEYELEEALEHASDNQSAHSSSAAAHTEGSKDRPKRKVVDRRRSRWRHLSPKAVVDEDANDDVPASLLVEREGEEDNSDPPLPPPPRSRNRVGGDAPIPGQSTARLRDQWNAARSRQPPHSQDPNQMLRTGHYSSFSSIGPKEKALWRWANVENLDNFLKDVYVYFLENGIWCIVLSRVLNLLTLAFVVGFTTFLTNCIDYKMLPHSKTMDQIIIPKCASKMSASSTFFLWLFTLFWFGKLFQYVLDFRRLRHMQDFYEYLLGIPDADIQTISWQEVVSRLMTLRDANPATAGAVSAKHRKFIGSQSKQRMDAHDIANRLMRKENYLIALFNKEILDLTLPIPLLRNRQLFSRTLEWNINLCIMDYVFNEQGQVRPIFLKDAHRKALSEGLRRRFIFAGIMNIFIAPFIVVYFLLSYFFRYFNEYRKNPAQIGSRQYTPLAEWKFREFNELWHLFERRLKMSYEISNHYLRQFPKDKTVQLSRFVAFIAGALASVLAVASFVDPEIIFNFELTQDRTALFYLGIFGSIYAFARGNVPEETLIFEPEYALREVIRYTHYQPAHWEGKLHSDEVRREFAMLYQLKVVIFLEEILSMIFTPFVLWFSLPKCSDRLIDFFREFTVHVDGLGYVCSFAVFDFKKGTNVILQGRHIPSGGAPGYHDPRDDYYSTKDGKMLASYYGFLDNYVANPRLGPAFANPDRWDRIYQHPSSRQRTISSHTGRPGATRPPHFGAPPSLAGQNSLLHSVLLDPHHQPSASGLQVPNNRAATAQSRYRSARQTQPVGDTIRDEDEDAAPHASALQTQQSNEMPAGGVGTDDSQLEGSWRLDMAGDIGDNRVDDTEDVEAVVGGAGVLGLIQQFQKVGNEGRGAVNI
ncbi:hypothetical protein VTO42DRAFT_2785 [Malbranchea cinnamomea]